MKRISLLLVVVALTGVSCERHEFEGPNGTKRLHEPAGHGHDHEGGAAGHEKAPASHEGGAGHEAPPAH